MSASEDIEREVARALDGRTLSASALTTYNPEEFETDDGVDKAAVAAWVAENSTANSRHVRRQIPGQGMLGEGYDAAEWGRGAYARRHAKPESLVEGGRAPSGGKGAGAAAYKRRHPSSKNDTK